MEEKIKERFTTLLGEGKSLIESIPPLEIPTDQYGGRKCIPGRLESSVKDPDIPRYQSWLSSVANLLHNITSPKSYFAKECDQLMSDEGFKHGVPSTIVLKMYGLLKAANTEWEHGLLRNIKYVIMAATFDDFLDHAAFYHKGNKKTEASVLASTVLEDTVKKIANKNSIETSGLSLEPLINELVKVDVFTLVKGKRVKSYAGVRNHALHAEWDKFDVKDVGELIKGTRELVDEFL